MIIEKILGLKRKVGADRKVGVLFFGLVFLLGQSLTLKAQNDPKAEAIIKKVAAVYQSYSTIKASFTLTTTPASGRASVEKGSVWLKGKKFRLITLRKRFIAILCLLGHIARTMQR